MTYSSRIPADPAYTQLLGRAFYNFAYLEGGVLSIIAKLSPSWFSRIPERATAGKLAEILHVALQEATPALAEPLQVELEKFHALFSAAIKSRNRLLHAHPYTAPGGAQQLTYYAAGIEWAPEDVIKAAIQFEEAALVGNAIFHGALALVRN